ncbi:unnamed protein product [marine sediment metagenome]|uniref:Uncharacterized protein n=1 Tax=marine sediment metagenome TaxID=412755 RepID=X1AF55_9ZZZZ
MKFNLNEVQAMTQGLDVILGTELPIKPAYWLARFLDKVQSEMKAMDSARIKLIEKYAKKDKDGKPIFKKDKDGKELDPQQYDLTKKNMEIFTTEFTELGKEEFDVDFTAIKLADLGEIKLKPIVLVQLGKIIVE